MTTISRPKLNFTKQPASGVISTGPQRVLLVGQQTGTTYTSGTIVEDISNSLVEVNTVGKNSILGGMIRAFKKVNQETQLDILPLDDSGTAVNASGTVAFTSGPAGEDATIIVYVGSAKNHKYTISVTSGDTVTTIGDALETAINADTEAPFTATNTGGSVAIEFDNGGTIGNSTGLWVDGTIDSVTITLTAFTSGANDPTLTSVFDAVADDQRYQTIVWPYNADLTTLTDFLDPRWNADNIILDGVGIVSETDTLSNLKTALDSENSQNLIYHCNELIDNSDYKGSSVFELDYVISSYVAAIRSLRLTEDASLSSLGSGYVNRDNRGGPNLGAKPYFNTVLNELVVIPQGIGFTPTEIDEINDAGGFVIGNNTAKNAVLLGDVLTTYKTDTAGNPDVTYKYLNYVDTISLVTEFMFNNAKVDFIQHRLTDGNLEPGVPMANAASIKNAFVRYYTELSGPDFVLTRSGDENIKFFKDNLTVELDLSLGRATVFMKCPIVTQLRQINATIQVAFDTN